MLQTSREELRSTAVISAPEIWVITLDSLDGARKSTLQFEAKEMLTGIAAAFAKGDPT